MKREIKFRCWSFINKEMYFADEIYSFRIYDSGNVVYAPHYENDEFYTYSTDPSDGEYEVATMQYTGLNDKNGTEIYEGDIVFKFLGDHLVKERLKGVRGVVRFGTYLVNKDDWGIEHRATGWHMDFQDGSGSIGITEKMEVIGNIHQHPELLTPSNTTQHKI